MKVELYTVEINKSYDIKKFISFPWKIYRNDPFWVPPLIRDMKRKLNPGKNPFFEYGHVRLFLIFNDYGEVVGRIAAIFNPIHRELYNDRTGFYGFFECINSVDVARRLMDAVKDYLRAYDCIKVIGPVNFNTNNDSGMLLEGNRESPMIMCNYAPSYYNTLLAECGFEKVMDLFSYGGKSEHSFPAKYMKVVQRVISKPAIKIRPFNRHNISGDIAIIRDIYNRSFKDLWGFLPLTTHEADEMGKNMSSFSDDELVWIAYYDKKPVGIILALPDVNEILKGLNGRLFPLGIFKFLLKRHSIKGVRVLALAVLPEYRSIGIESLLIYRVHSRILAGGYQRAEFSVINENNTRMRAVLKGVGFKIVKVYRLYQGSIPVQGLPDGHIFLKKQHGVEEK